MKRILTALSLVAVMASCKSKIEPVTDQAKVLSAIDSTEFAAFQTWKEQQAETKAINNNRTVRYVEHRHTSAASNRTANTNTTTTAAKKKGWSKAAKGAVIGGVSGGVIGGVVSKRNRAAGIVIGTVLGGGVGYGIGRTIDKKDGRY
ncbi:MAG: glycine zipper domain-containing protein [Lacibacter sp.]